MRLLLIHSDHIEYETKKRTKFAEESCKPSDSLEDAIVAFCAVEAPDEEGVNDVISQAVTAIVDNGRKGRV